MSTDNQLDRQRGTLIGLAVGDALGAAVEFQPPGSFEPVTDFRAGGPPHGLEPGEWTDDTSMGVALAGSIAQVGWDLNDQARRYVAWWRQGECSVNGRCFDIGITTQLSFHASPVAAMREHLAILRNEQAATGQSCVWLRCLFAEEVHDLVGI